TETRRRIYCGVVLVLLADDGDVLVFNARGLDVIPIAPRIALADDKVHVDGKFLRVLKIQTPLPVMITVPELARRAVGHADLPDRFPEALQLPCELAERFVLRRGHGHIRQREFPKHAVANRAQRVVARPYVANREA